MPENSKSSFDEAFKNNPHAAGLLLNPLGPVPDNNPSAYDFCSVWVHVWINNNLLIVQERGDTPKTRYIPNGFKNQPTCTYNLLEFNFEE